MNTTKMIRDIDFSAIEPVRKHCITYAKDGNTVVKPYKSLYPCENITDRENDKGLFIEIVEGDYSNSFQLWEDLEVITIPQFWLQDSLTVGKIIEGIDKYPYFHKDSFTKLIQELLQSNGWINNLQIQILTLMGELDLAKQCYLYHNEQLRKREEEEKDRLDKARIEQEEEERKHTEQILQQVEAAETAFLNHQMLKNEIIEDKSTILYLMKKHGIKVPLKTQGWINKALAQVEFKSDGSITYRYYTSSKCSTVFHKYLKELEEKIINTVPEKPYKD